MCVCVVVVRCYSGRARRVDAGGSRVAVLPGAVAQRSRQPDTHRRPAAGRRHRRRQLRRHPQLPRLLRSVLREHLLPLHGRCHHSRLVAPRRVKPALHDADTDSPDTPTSPRKSSPGCRCRCRCRGMRALQTDGTEKTDVHEQLLAPGRPQTKADLSGGREQGSTSLPSQISVPSSAPSLPNEISG